MMRSLCMTTLIGCGLGLLLGACSSISEPCRLSVRLAKRFPLLDHTVTAPEIGKEYYVDGLFYSGFHESGLVAIPDLPARLLDEFKWEAYCIKWPADCLDVTEAEERRLGGRTGLARFRGVVRFLGPESQLIDELHLCRNGVVEVVSLSAYRPIATHTAR